MMPPFDELKDLQRSLSLHATLGVAALVLVLGGVGTWASSTVVASAVVAAGSLVVDGKIKAVQHPSGGVVSEILVRDGQAVESGDTLVRLDDTEPRINYQILRAAVNQLHARHARLEAEASGAATVATSAAIIRRMGSDAAEVAMEAERRVFESRRIARRSQQDQLLQQITQLEEQIKGLDTQQSAKVREISLISKELEGIRRLYDRGLVSLNRLNSLDRSEARLQGERGQLIATAASTRAQISEIRIQLIQVDQDLRSQVETEQRDIQSRLDELVEKEVAAQERIRRLDIRAPSAGTVHALNIHTVGAVITPAEVILEIVPSHSDLVVTVRILPSMIDQVKLAQVAFLKFTAFDRNVTPDIVGKVTRISADLETDPRTGQVYYGCDIEILPEERKKLTELKLLPGMPVEAFIQGHDRTVSSYFTKPVMDHLGRVFVER